ncbi:MAG: DHH family phosphoesterase [Nanoarchaeota archaeon]
MLNHIKNFAQSFLEKSKNKNIQLIGHFDTDGITSTAILTKTLERLEKSFSTKIVKQLSLEEIKKIPKEKIILLVDLGSANLKELSQLENTIFILDHHEIKSCHELDAEKMTFCNPHLYEDAQDICSSELAYLFSTAISSDNKDLAHLAIVGMVGDTMEKNINKIRNQIIKEADVQIKKGLLMYPSTRPIDRTLEYSSRPFIPGITGNRNNILELLKDAGIEKIGKQYKSLIDLNNDEMKQLTTAIMLRLSSKEASEHIGNLYLIKFFNKIEDARELSAIINACSRLDRTDIALLVCLGNSDARKKAERLYLKYRQHILSGLKFIEKNGFIKGEEYVIINAQGNIKDTIIGTLASILSFSSIYKDGTIIIAMAYNQNKIKISTRLSGKNKKSDHNLKELLESITAILGRGESGGHKYAAGCTIDLEDEHKFIELVKRKLEYQQTVRVYS